MVIKLEDCIENMSDEEKGIYYNESASNYFLYLKNSSSFQSAFERLEEEDWIYLFEKFYLVTYKAMSEEASSKILDGIFYLYRKLGMLLSKKGSPNYNDHYRSFQMIQSVFRDREVNDDLLKALEETMASQDEEDLRILFFQHEEACLLRKHRNYMYEEEIKAHAGILTGGEIAAINCFNRSYEREKRLVLERGNVL